MTRVKICGITDKADALFAVTAGASALGFVFYEKSSRNISPAEAKKIIDTLPPFVIKVGVFVNAEKHFLEEAKAEAGFDVYQFHGEESPEMCAAFGKNYIKAVRIKDAESLESLDLYNTRTFLFDTWSPSAYGGTGESFSWDMLAAEKICDRFVILSGGLRPENIALAVRTVRPYAVDVSSGVESSPGVKSHSKIARFMEEVRGGANKHRV